MPSQKTFMHFVALGAAILVTASTMAFSEGPVEPVESHTLAFSIADTGVEVDAGAFYVFDVETGTRFASKNESSQLPIASITKLPAAVAWLETVPLLGSTTINWSDLNAEGRAGKLSYGDTLVNHDLLFPLLLESSNDAAAAMERETNDEVVGYMNKLANNLGLQDTSFVDASGLSPENVSTAKELAVLVSNLKSAKPHVFDITTLSQYIYEDNGWINNNPLVHQVGYKGGKHGYTYEANRTIVSIFEESFLGGEREVGYVLLGSSDLAADIDVLRQFVHASVSYE